MSEIPGNRPDTAPSIVVRTADGGVDFSDVEPGDVVSVKVGNHRPIMLPAERHITSSGDVLVDASDGIHEMLDGAQVAKLGSDIMSLPGEQK